MSHYLCPDSKCSPLSRHSQMEVFPGEWWTVVVWSKGSPLTSLHLSCTVSDRVFTGFLWEEMYMYSDAQRHRYWVWPQRRRLMRFQAGSPDALEGEDYFVSYPANFCYQSIEKVHVLPGLRTLCGFFYLFIFLGSFPCCITLRIFFIMSLCFFSCIKWCSW